MIIFVGNLSLDTSKDELRWEFMAFGEVVSVTIMNDKYIGSGQQRGYAYVEMESKSEGKTAIINLDGKRLRRRVISVVEALPLSDNKNHGILDNNKRTGRFGIRVRERKY